MLYQYVNDILKIYINIYASLFSIFFSRTPFAWTSGSEDCVVNAPYVFLTLNKIIDTITDVHNFRLVIYAIYKAKRLTNG